MPTYLSALNTVVMTRDDRRADLCLVDVFALTKVTTKLEFLLAGEDALLGAINNEFNMELTNEQVELTNPIASTEKVQYNSRFTLNCLPSFEFRGTFDFFYNRRPIAEMFENLSMTGLIVDDEETVHELIPKINAISGKMLSVEDVQNGPIATSPLTLIASATSFYFLPNSTQELSFTRR